MSAIIYDIDFPMANLPRTQDLKELPQGCNAYVGYAIVVGVADIEARRGEAPNNHFIAFNRFCAACICICIRIIIK